MNHWIWKNSNFSLTVTWREPYPITRPRLLMAVFIRGMTLEETVMLTQCMRIRRAADLSEIPGIKVDKHSTGGVETKPP